MDRAAVPRASSSLTTSAGGHGFHRTSGRARFPSDNWWNHDIASAPVDPQSDAYIDFIGRTRTAHPDFRPPQYGIPFIGVAGSEARRAVAFVDDGSGVMRAFVEKQGAMDARWRAEPGVSQLDRRRPEVIRLGWW